MKSKITALLWYLILSVNLTGLRNVWVSGANLWRHLPRWDQVDPELMLDSFKKKKKENDITGWWWAVGRGSYLDKVCHWGVSLSAVSWLFLYSHWLLSAKWCWQIFSTHSYHYGFLLKPLCPKNLRTKPSETRRRKHKDCTCQLPVTLITT